MTQPAERAAYLKRLPETRVVDAVLYDLCGTAISKRAPVRNAGKLWSDGVAFCAGITTLDALGTCWNVNGSGFSDGNPDATSTPLPGTLVPVPWAEVPTAKVQIAPAPPNDAAHWGSIRARFWQVSWHALPKLVCALWLRTSWNSTSSTRSATKGTGFPRHVRPSHAARPGHPGCWPSTSWTNGRRPGAADRTPDQTVGIRGVHGRCLTPRIRLVSLTAQTRPRHGATCPLALGRTRDYGSARRPMMRESCDILISGGGVAGLTAAAALGSAGFRVILVDPAPPVTEAEADGADLRTTAFLQPSVAVLDRAGLWSRLLPHAAPLQIMRIVDAGGAEPVARLVKDFDASEISDAPFGWNLPNWLLRREMVARLAELPNVSFRPGLGFARMLPRDAEALVSLTDGTRVSARLVIGADGRNSPVREALGISARTMRYGQKALAFAVTHDLPHGSISTEVHRKGGPFTLVPLPDRDGKPASAIVWMETGPEIARLAALPVPEFETEMTLRSTGILGALRLVTRRSVWPIISQIAARMSGPRTVLMAEAAHVVPPIGAQGLNMSLADLTCLLGLVECHRDDPGQPAVTEAYHRARHHEVQGRVTGIDLLNRASMAGAPMLRDLRAKALETLYSARPVRQVLMRAGLGLR